MTDTPLTDKELEAITRDLVGPSWVPRLVAEVRSLRARVVELEDALRAEEP